MPNRPAARRPLSVSAVVAAALAISACRSPRPFDGRREATPVPLEADRVEVPLADAQGVLLVPVLIDGGGPYMLALDTGSTTTVLSPETADRAGLRTEARRATILTELGTKVRTVEQAFVRELRIGSARYRNLGALVADLDGLSRTIGRTLDGIVGMPVLRHHTWTIDVERNVVTLSDEPVPEPGPAPDGGLVIALDLSEELPQIEVAMAGRRVKAILDTGQRAPLAIGPDLAAELKPWLEVIGTSSGHVLDGPVSREIARFRGTVSVGPLALDRPVVLLATGTRVGVGAFGGSVLSMDLATGRLWIRAPVSEASGGGPRRSD